MLAFFAIQPFVDVSHLLQQFPVLLLCELLHLRFDLTVERTQPIFQRPEIFFIFVCLAAYETFQFGVLLAHLSANSLVVLEFFSSAALACRFVCEPTVAREAHALFVPRLRTQRAFRFLRGPVVHNLRVVDAFAFLLVVASRFAHKLAWLEPVGDRQVEESLLAELVDVRVVVVLVALLHGGVLVVVVVPAWFVSAVHNDYEL